MNDSALTILADPTRQRIIHCLRRGPATVGEIAAGLPVSRPAVSQHLRQLKAARLVNEERQGTRHYFRLNPQGFAQLRDHIDQMWQSALDAFAMHIDKKTKPQGTPRRHAARRRDRK